ncbi:MULTISPECIES: hypothetical protein [Geobacillus]|uniref:Integral membrane protein n=1 Tax=Geobacillus thermoleovorans CCB_US3_UF5 TaxID=1111068 RepID=A0ABN3ZSW3_GEOTH|nr:MULTISPECIES: hypothetical protein [Geobacillus]AEV18408.1 Integral membrane protein [Geobacillus thermoleovorans CCB_US3_UF5]GAJ59770.1 hypothetical protein B23_2995 [Geobacillus thermoleovorans B23]
MIHSYTASRRKEGEGWGSAVGFALRDGLPAAIKAHLIIRYSIEAFDRAIVIREVISWGFTILYVLGFIRISNILNDGSKSKEASG